jgi:hypothetical protein
MRMMGRRDRFGSGAGADIAVVTIRAAMRFAA